MFNDGYVGSGVCGWALLVGRASVCVSSEEVVVNGDSVGVRVCDGSG